MIDLSAVRLAQKSINVGLSDFVCGRIALGLDSPRLAVLVLEDEIDAAAATPTPWVFAPEPDLRDLS